MPIRALSLQRPFSVRAPCIDGGGLVAKRKQPRCSRCGETGHNIRTCGECAWLALGYYELVLELMFLCFMFLLDVFPMLQTSNLWNFKFSIWVWIVCYYGFWLIWIHNNWITATDLNSFHYSSTLDGKHGSGGREKCEEWWPPSFLHLLHYSQIFISLSTEQTLVPRFSALNLIVFLHIFLLSKILPYINIRRTIFFIRK